MGLLHHRHTAVTQLLQHVWEMPLVTFSLVSAVVRVLGTLRLLRRASIFVFGQGAKLQSYTPWRIPADLKPFIARCVLCCQGPARI